MDFGFYRLNLLVFIVVIGCFTCSCVTLMKALDEDEHTGLCPSCHSDLITKYSDGSCKCRACGYEWADYEVLEEKEESQKKMW